MTYQELLQVPLIKTSLPGPKAAKLIAQDEEFTSPSYTRFYPLVVNRGYGSTIEDVDGNLFLDFTSGIAVCSTGHCHPRIVEVIKKQAEMLLHMSGTDFYYEPQANLAKKLATLAPGISAKKVFFSNSGTESVEAAFKLARYHTRRKQIISFFGGFHGRTMGALSLTASKNIQRRGFDPLIPGVSHAPFGNCYRCPVNKVYGTCQTACVESIEKQLFRHTVSPDEVAAFIVEPIQGEGGYVVPPIEFHRNLKTLAEKHGILYIADEVQSGMGRTGKMFAIEHFGIEPDIICLAKGIASGMPLGAMIAKSEIMDWPKGSHASTFGGNPVACVAALETITLLEEGLMDNARKVGQFMFDLLDALKDKHTLIGDVRGKGLMLAIDLVKDRDTREPASRERDAVVQACFKKGLLLLGCGVSGIRFCPPLVVRERDAKTAVRILDEVLTEITGWIDDK
ncbi:MAG: 5-aminovalerate aminotransferase DavT [Planctomycetota bacterium]